MKVWNIIGHNPPKYGHCMAVESALLGHTFTYSRGYLLGHTPVACQTIIHALDVLFLTKDTLTRPRGLHTACLPPPFHLRCHKSLRQDAGLFQRTTHWALTFTLTPYVSSHTFPSLQTKVHTNALGYRYHKENPVQPPRFHVASR